MVMPQPSRQVRIARMVPVDSMDSNRRGQRDTLITYVLRDVHFYEVRVPGDPPTADAAATAVEKDARARAAILDRQITI